ncbi:MAG: hypothetical protein WB441_16640 [Nocardioidaceae bacterium]
MTRRVGPGRPVFAEAALVVGALAVIGALAGVLWSRLVDPAEFTRLARGGSMAEEQLSRQFAADGWFVVIGTLAGVLAGVVGTWRRVADPLPRLTLTLLGSAVAAAACAGVGHLLGPGDPGPLLSAAPVGTRVPERLDVDTFVVYLSWPLGVLVGTLAVLLGRRTDTNEPGVADH